MPLDTGENTIAAAAVNAAGYRIPAGTPAPIAAVITFALAQLGKPYVYGATGPNAYDCSGLVQAAYARIGVHLPRTTFDQVNVGRPVYSTSQLQPGALLFIPAQTEPPQPPATSACTWEAISSYRRRRPAKSSNSAHWTSGRGSVPSSAD